MLAPYKKENDKWSDILQIVLHLYYSKINFHLVVEKLNKLYR